MTTKQKKTEATKKEMARVSSGYNLPARNVTIIYDELGNAIAIRRAWQSGNRFGWHKWENIK